MSKLFNVPDVPDAVLHRNDSSIENQPARGDDAEINRMRGSLPIIGERPHDQGSFDVLPMRTRRIDPPVLHSVPALEGE